MVRSRKTKERLREPSEFQSDALLRFCCDARLATSPLAFEHNTDSCRLGVITSRVWRTDSLVWPTVNDTQSCSHASFFVPRSFFLSHTFSSHFTHTLLPYSSGSPPGLSLSRSLCRVVHPSRTHSFTLSISLHLFLSSVLIFLPLLCLLQLHLALHPSLFIGSGVFWISRCISFESPYTNYSRRPSRVSASSRPSRYKH